jgi:hypothetical protein
MKSERTCVSEAVQVLVVSAVALSNRALLPVGQDRVMGDNTSNYRQLMQPELFEMRMCY